MTIDAGLLAPPPLLRTLRGAGDAPYPGDLRAGHPPSVWVPVDQLPPEVWRVRAGEHVLAPLDIARAGRGQAALIPHCPERLGAALATSADTLSPGAVVTVAVSLLRGAAEADRCDIADGVWWVDAAGCPLLAATGELPWRDESLELLSQLAEGVGEPLRAAVREAADVLRMEHPPPRRIEAAEDALFAAATPSPLREDPHRRPTDPSPRRVVSFPRIDEGEADEGPADPRGTAGLREGDLIARVRIAGAGVIGSASRGIASIRARGRPRAAARDRADRPRPRRRRAPLLTAVGIGVAVVAIGLSWPAGEAPSDAAITSADDATDASAALGGSASGSPAGSHGSTPPPPSSSGAEDARVEKILTALAACAADAEPGCDGVLENAAAPSPVGIVANGAVARAVDLLDEYGGVSVYRVSAAGMPTQILVLVDVNGQWLVRDVYDVADQP